MPSAFHAHSSRPALLTDGPSGPEEQYLLELINETRDNPVVMLNRILAARAANSEIDNNLSFWQVNLDVLRNEIQAGVPSLFSRWPLAWNPLLANAALSHSQLMQQNQLETPVHQLPGEPDPTTRITNTGYLDPNFGYDIAENLPAILTDLLAAHASMLIDWGPGDNGMETGRGHRVNMLTSGLPNACGEVGSVGTYDEIGIGIVPGSGSSSAKRYITQDFGYRCNREPGYGYVVGVVYGSGPFRHGVYAPGAGFGGVTLTFQSRIGDASTTTNPWGGYQILLRSADWYATVSGPGINNPINFGFFNTGRVNVHLNFVVRP
jgi:hypothetical protein